MYGMNGVNSMYMYVGNISGLQAAHRLALKTRTHMYLVGNKAYVSEDEKERFEEKLIRFASHSWIDIASKGTRHNLVCKPSQPICPRHYNRCRKDKCDK